MIFVYNNSKWIPIDVDAHVISELSGLKTCDFQISIDDPNYQYFKNEVSVLVDGLYYKVKCDMSEDENTETIECYLDRDDFKSTMWNKSFYSGSVTLSNCVSQILPSGWTHTDTSFVTDVHTIDETENDVNALEILEDIANTYGVVFEFDNANKILTSILPANTGYKGFYIINDLNTSGITYTSDTYEFCTRIYGYGAYVETTDSEGNVTGGQYVTFADINDGKEYVEDKTYADVTISKTIRDERFTDASNLLAYCQSELEKCAYPQISYEIVTVNLAKLDPDKYNLFQYQMHDLVKYIDKRRGVEVYERIVQYEYTQNHPELDVITLSQISIDVTDANKSLTATIMSEAQKATTAANNYAGVQLNLAKATIYNLVVSKLEADYIDADTIDATYATIEDLDATNATVSNLTARTVTVEGNLTAAQADITDLKAADVNITGRLDAAEGNITTLTADNATINQKLTAAEADITSLTADNATINGKLTAAVGDISYIQSNYAKSDISNVNTSWITNGIIKNGAITDAMIGSLSANKLTAGTINGSVINVTNLNADNITAGTLNGQRIGEGTLSLDKLSEDVYTEAEVDAKLATMQSEIDGAIETYTGTDIPTLNNTPASSWTTNDDKDKHVGDVYYVVNAGNQADGYCYRFANTGTTANPSYGWILIKDSDVTAALQRLIDAEGDIDGLQSFESTTSSWITETDEEIRLLKGRTTNVETSLGDKVSTSTFNELSQTVDTNSASITTLSETVETKANSDDVYTKTKTDELLNDKAAVSTVTTLSTTVNDVQQTATSNSSKISNLTTRLGTNADGTQKSTDIVSKYSDLSQSLDTFKSTVSSTYATQANLNAEINQRKAMYGTSSTAAGTTAKAVTCANFVLYTGARVAVTFSNANTATTPTLNVNSTGAKTIKSFSGAALSEAEYKWAAGSTLEFIYDGENWRLADEGTLKRLNAAEGTLSTHSTTIEQNTNAIALKANAADVYTKTQTDGLITTEVNNRNAAITASADAINLSVSQTYTTKTEFENLEVGGRNLIVFNTAVVFNNSADINAYTITNTVADTRTAIRIQIQNYKNGSYVNNLLSGPVISGIGNFTVAFTAENATSSTRHVRIKHNGTSKDIGVYFSLSEDIAAGDKLVFSMDVVSNDPSTVGGMVIKNLKLERGDKPTDWTPAPEDLEAYTDSAVSAAKTEIKQTTDNISLEVSKKVGSSEIISKINQSAESITIDASKVNIAGTITAINDNTTTTINGGKITTGTLTIGALSSATQSQVLNSEIEVGGRNLLYKTPFVGGNTTSNGNYSIILDAQNRDTHFRLYSRERLVSGNTYTISCEASGITDESVYYNFPIFRQESTINGLTINKNGLNSFTFVMNDTEIFYHSKDTVDDLTMYRILMDDNGRNVTNQSGPITLTHFKLEKGNKATDWTPAPEDVDSDISDASKTATSYIVANSTGLMVAKMVGSEGQTTPSTATTRNVFITNNDVQIRNGQTVLASYGSTITLGQSSGRNILIDGSSINIRQGSTVLASFGTETVIGTSSAGSIKLNSNGFSAYFDIVSLAEISYGSSVTDGSTVELAPYYRFGLRKVPSTWANQYDSTKTYDVSDLVLYNGDYYACVADILTAEAWTSSHWVLLDNAIGSHSMCEGYYTIASRLASHAEGRYTISQGEYAHSEGYGTMAIGQSSHSEGRYTYSSGDDSHCEGCHTSALRRACHAEGWGTTASGDYSHTQNLYTIASYDYCTAIGKYNADGNYALMIGNGTGDSARSNAFTVDWSGNVTASGNFVTPAEVKAGYGRFGSELSTNTAFLFLRGTSDTQGMIELYNTSSNRLNYIELRQTYTYTPNSFSAGNVWLESGGAIELNGSYPYIDFHGGGSSLDYTNRLVATDSNGSFMIQAQASIASDFNCTIYKSESYAVRCRVQNANGYGDLQISADKTFGLYARTRSNWLIYVGASGNSSMPLSSDRRIKNYIQDTPTNEAVDLLRSIKVRQFTYKGDENEVVTNGFYAQDIRDHLISKGIGYRPYLNIQSNEEDNESIYYDINMDENKVQYGLEYHKLVPELWLGWQYHDTEIDKLKKRITTLELLLIKNNITFD